MKRSNPWMAGLLLVPAVIHLLPLSGVLGADALTRLYGLDFSAPDLQILMRHRAVLFGLLGGLMAIAAFRPALQGVAIVLGLASVVSFLALALGVEGYGEPIGRIVLADTVALPCLVAAALLKWRHPGPGIDVG